MPGTFCRGFPESVGEMTKSTFMAVIEPVNFYKDHLSNDQIKAVLFHGKDEELLPQSYLLRAKIK